MKTGSYTLNTYLMTSRSQNFSSKTNRLLCVVAVKKYPCMQIFSFLALLVFSINSGQTQPQTNKHTHTYIQRSSFNSRDSDILDIVIISPQNLCPQRYHYIQYVLYNCNSNDYNLKSKSNSNCNCVFQIGYDSNNNCNWWRDFLA